MSTQPTQPSTAPSTVDTQRPTMTWSGNGALTDLSQLLASALYFSSRLQDYKQRLESDRKAIEHTMNVSTSFSDKEAAQHLEAASLLKDRESHITQMSGLNEELYSTVPSIASCPTGRAPPPDFFRQASANGNVLGYMAGVLLVREECSRKAQRKEAIEHYKKLFSALEDHDQKVRDNEETYRSLVHSSNGTSNRSMSTMVASTLQGLCTKAQQVGTTIGQATRESATSLFNTAAITLANAPVVQSLISVAGEVPAALGHRDEYPVSKKRRDQVPVDVQLAGQGFIPP